VKFFTLSVVVETYSILTSVTLSLSVNKSYAHLYGFLAINTRTCAIFIIFVTKKERIGSYEGPNTYIIEFNEGLLFLKHKSNEILPS
jgi:hypothetical protein